MKFAIRQLKQTIDIALLKEMYECLSTKFQHRKYVVEADIENHSKMNVGEWNFGKAFGWALQTWVEDKKNPLPFLNIMNGAFEDMSNTEMFQCLPEEILTMYPGSWEHCVSCHPQGVRVGCHKDTGKFYKIHIPINSPKNSYWIYGNNRKEINLLEGHSYLVNVNLLHGTINRDADTRIHLIFKIPYDLGNSLEFKTEYFE